MLRYSLLLPGLFICAWSSPIYPSRSSGRFTFRTQLQKPQLQPRSYIREDLLPVNNFEYWTENVLSIIFPPYDPFYHPGLSSFGDKSYVTPGYSNGYGSGPIPGARPLPDSLDYPDPHLITGPQARKAADYLYSQGLFFGDIPHIRAVQRNQELRLANGLPRHLLGSIRINSPFPTLKFR